MLINPAGAVRHSLRAKVTLGVVLPLVVLLGALTVIEYRRHEAAVFATLSFQASQTGQVIKNSLRHAMLVRNRRSIQQILDAIREDATIRAVQVLNTTGQVAYAPGGVGVGQRLDNRDPNCQPCHSLSVADRPKSVIVTLPDGQRVFRSMIPIENEAACHQCHAANQRLIGELLTDISTAEVDQALATDLQEHTVWSVATLVVAVAVVNVALSRLVLSRLGRVANGLARFGRSHLSLRLADDKPDEIGRLVAAFNEMGRRLEADEAEKETLARDLRQEAAQRSELLKRLITSQEEERQRVARDLHDDLGQELSGLALGLEAVERLWSAQPEQARRQLRLARGQIANLTNRAYDLILALRPSALDDLGLVPALRAHAERAFRNSATLFQFEADGVRGRLPKEVETALFRTLQEALSNIVRHAAASQVRLSLTLRAGQLVAEVVDDGRGFDLAEVRLNGANSRGLGLLGMQERMAQCGGALHIASQPGAGTRLTIWVPVKEAGSG